MKLKQRWQGAPVWKRGSVQKGGGVVNRLGWEGSRILKNKIWGGRDGNLQKRWPDLFGKGVVREVAGVVARDP